MKRLASLGLAGVLLLAGCSSTDINSNPQAIKAQGPQEVFLMVGKVDSNAEISIVSKIPAKVSKVAVDLGDLVAKGDPLIYLDTSDIAGQVKQAQSAVAAAEANLRKVKKGARPEQKAQAKAAYDAAKTNYEILSQSLASLEEQVGNGQVTQSQVDTLKAQVAGARAQYISTREQYNILSRGETTDTIAALQAQVNQAQGAYEYAKALQNNGVITSPVDGRITFRNIDLGELAVTGQPLMTVVNDQQLIINAFAPSSLLSQIKEGQQVIIKFAEYPDKTFTGEIKVISSAIDARSKNYPVKVTLNDSNENIKPGMIAQIGIKR